MASNYRRSSLHPHVIAVMDETGEEDPFQAVRVKARSVAEQYHQLLRETPPFNMKAVASVRGLRWTDDDPKYSADSEIAPEKDGSVVLRVNRSRPLSRQRFSIGHEIGHTLFPDYQLAVRCRKAIDRSWADPNDLLETLCDVAASELLFPLPWFGERVNQLTISAEGISGLADDYEASREAAVRRFVELHPEPLASVFFSWKLKPTQARAVARDKNQLSMFEDMPRELPTPMLRVDYAILNDAFQRRFTEHIPKDKSVPSEGPIHAASVTQTLQNGRCDIDLGTVRGKFDVYALPVFTQEDLVGPEGACSIAAVLRPK